VKIFAAEKKILSPGEGCYIPGGMGHGFAVKAGGIPGDILPAQGRKRIVTQPVLEPF